MVGNPNEHNANCSIFLSVLEKKAMIRHFYSPLIRNYKTIKFYARVTGLAVLITFLKRSVSIFVPAVGGGGSCQTVFM
jgi:hypothetical protein